MQKNGEDQVQLNPEQKEDHMHAEEGEHQVQLNAGSHGGHLHAEGKTMPCITMKHHAIQSNSILFWACLYRL